jgi:DNA-binding HxlR family transcriptional regulator
MDKSKAASRRSYNQYCGLASALDVLGERWTLLIIRELLMGPRRYTDLSTDLPGLGSNLLAERLKTLLDANVIRQVDLKGTGSRLSYELTEVGQELRPIVLGLARWGMDFIGPYTPQDVVRPHWGFLAVESMFRTDRIDPDTDEIYQFDVDGEIFHIEARKGASVRAVKGPAEQPTMTVTTDAASFIEVGAGRLKPLAAVITGRLRLDGDSEAMLRCCDLLGLDAGQLPAVVS